MFLSLSHSPSFFLIKGSIKLWNPDYIISLNTYESHSKLVNAVKFAKNMTNVFASVSADGYLKIWNTSHPRPIASILVQNDTEVSIQNEMFYKMHFY